MYWLFLPDDAQNTFFVASIISPWNSLTRIQTFHFHFTEIQTMLQRFLLLIHTIFHIVFFLFFVRSSQYHERISFSPTPLERNWRQPTELSHFAFCFNVYYVNSCLSSRVIYANTCFKDLQLSHSDYFWSFNLLRWKFESLLVSLCFDWWTLPRSVRRCHYGIIAKCPHFDCCAKKLEISISKLKVSRCLPLL